MAHHILEGENIDWIKNMKNCLLIRHPRDVILSYSKKNEINSIQQLGYLQQIKIYENIKLLFNDFFILITNLNMMLKQKLHRLSSCFIKRVR